MADVEVRLFATFRQGRFDKRVLDLPAGTRLREVVRDLRIPEHDISLPLVNGRYVALDRELQPHDVVSLFPAVGGG